MTTDKTDKMTPSERYAVDLGFPYLDPDDLPDIETIEVHDESAVFYAKADATYSGNKISDGTIRQPFTYEGSFWICTSYLNGTTHKFRVTCAEIVPLDDWPHLTHTYAERSMTTLRGKKFYVGVKITWKGEDFVITNRRLHITSDREKPAQAKLL